jgi:hypothetical protein
VIWGGRLACVGLVSLVKKAGHAKDGWKFGWVHGAF